MGKENKSFLKILFYILLGFCVLLCLFWLWYSLNEHITQKRVKICQQEKNMTSCIEHKYCEWKSMSSCLFCLDLFYVCGHKRAGNPDYYYGDSLNIVN